MIASRASLAALVALAAITGTAVACRDTRAAWREVRADGYVVQMPGEPQVRAHTDPGETVTAKLSMRLLTLPNGDGELTAARTVFENRGKGEVETDTMLDAMMDGAIGEPKTIVRRRERISLGAVRGLEVEGAHEASPETQTLIRYYWVPPATAYLLIVTSPRSGRAWTERAKFVDSFRIE